MRLAAILLCSFACAKSVPVPAGLGEPCVGNNDCATGFLCAAGRCVLPANLGGCEPDRKRCNGADVEQCDHNGLAWSRLDTCGTGCSAGACKPQVCTPGKTRCEGNAAEQCSPDGATWALVQICPSLCAADTGRCRAPVCTPFSTRCDPSGATGNAQICDSYGAGWQDLPCASGQVCDGGRCQDVICSAGQTRCSANGGSVESCNAKGDGWAASQSCGIRCGISAGVAACLAPACVAGDLRCSPAVASAVEQCLPDRSGWSFVTFCATGCTSGAPGAASCAPVVCAPLSRRCAATGSGVESCSADGSGWSLTDTCPQSCAGGTCVTSSAGCAAGDLRCNAADAQTCAAVPGSPGVTQWVTQATCVAGCSSGACLPGGSCAPPAPGQPAMTLTAAAASATGDGVSTVLVYSNLIRGADGAPLPDGLDFSVAAMTGSAPQAVIVAPAGTVSALRVRSLAGRVHFLVRAPALAGADQAITVSATLLGGASCAAATSIAFTAAASQTVLVGEDFTRPSERNLAVVNPANWDTSRGALIAAWPNEVGQGEDGPLVVSGTVNLSAVYAPGYGVIGLSGSTATVDSSAPGLNGGDEVLLWDAQGSASGISNAGGYEFLHVAARDGSRVRFVETPAGTYGIANDNDVATQRVQLVRVPHFSSVSVPAGATLTANPWDGIKGGTLVFRVSGTASVLGNIAMDAAGFRGGRAYSYTGEDVTGLPGLGGGGAGGYNSGGSYGAAGTGSSPGQLYGLPLLGRLHLGAGGGGGNNQSVGGAGGGVIAIFAGSLSLANGTSTQVGRIHADGQPGQSTAGGGAGGSVWISAPALTVGTGTGAPASAQGGAPNGGGAGGAGRVRFDFLAGTAGDAASGCARSSPSCVVGIGGPLVGQSLDAFALTDAQKALGVAIKSAALSLALGSPANASYQASAASADPPDFGAPLATVPGTTQFRADTAPAQGTRFRWRVQLQPAPGAPQQLLGMQWSLQVN